MSYSATANFWSSYMIACLFLWHLDALFGYMLGSLCMLGSLATGLFAPFLLSLVLFFFGSFLWHLDAWVCCPGYL